MATYWISKTLVRIEPNEMTRDEAITLAEELLVDLKGKIRGKNMKWTEEEDRALRECRNQRMPIREIANIIFGDDSKVGAISSRIQRLQLPVSEVARKRGQASQAARAARKRGRASQAARAAL